MNEKEWASKISKMLHDNFRTTHLPNLKNISAKDGEKLLYAREINAYTSTGYDDASDKMEFETDILISEKSPNENWKPRVVIETKINGVSTHDAITYSAKAAYHKSVHPYLRYGIFIGNLDSIPGRLYRHGENFDFMITWPSLDAHTNEFHQLFELIAKEIDASRQLEEILYSTRKKSRSKYSILHRPLVVR